MAVVLLSIEAQQDGKRLARVRHEGHELVALVSGDAESLLAKIGRECIVEMDYTRLVEWKECPEFVDEQSCIKPSLVHPGAITVIGRVHSLIAVGEDEEIIDLYIQNGPEFLAIAKSELGGPAPSVGTGMEVTLEGLCFYPTNT